MDYDKITGVLKDIFGVITFIALVILGVIFINAFIFRSFNVEGASMEKTMVTGDKLIVNKLPTTIARLQGQSYKPPRGQIIVFKNPEYSLNMVGKNEYIVKRVIGLSEERVRTVEGKVTVFNKAHPNGFDPDILTKDQEGSPTSGDVDIKVPRGEIFVMGDHRQSNYSLDSRSGLGTIPLQDIIGPVGLRIFPFTDFRSF